MEEEDKARRIHPWLWRLRNHLIASQWAIQRGKKVVFVLHKLCIKSLAKPFSGIALEVFFLYSYANQQFYRHRQFFENYPCLHLNWLVFENERWSLTKIETKKKRGIISVISGMSKSTKGEEEPFHSLKPNHSWCSSIPMLYTHFVRHVFPLKWSPKEWIRT